MFLVPLALAATAFGARAALPDGTVAPLFTAQAALAGKDFSFSLSDALKKGPVVVYFYPKSFTRICTEEAHDFADAMGEFQNLGAAVIGVSADDIATQREFSAMECRDKFPVAADPQRQIIRSYDVASESSPFARRTSYVIAPDGKVLSSVYDPGATKHIETALAVLREWRATHKS
ncbi:MAG: peroxiredoxin [Hyphomicrobiales bacterium]|nr:peroxiredoxin [Hyphomicrobiales bacterium]